MKPKINYFQIYLGILAGIILGMVIMFLLFQFSFERILKSANGIISNVNVEINETKAVESVWNFAYKYYPDKFSNITYTNYSNCNGMIDKGCTNI